MLPDVGGVELLVIAAVALIVVGPKDLPVMLRKLGEFMGRIRRMAADFRSSFDDMARQSELDDLRKEVEAMRDAAKSQIEEGEAAIRNDVLPPEFSFENPFGDDLLAPFEPTPETPAAEKPRRKKAAAKAETKPVTGKAPAKSSAKPKTPRRKTDKSIVS
jgi:sec-independent protein translocase protein TatB